MAIRSSRIHGAAQSLIHRTPANVERERETAPAPATEKHLQPNRGVPLNLDWVEDIRVNTSAVERRADTLTKRRTVKKEWQAAWLLKAITCMDLTTLSGDDTV